MNITKQHNIKEFLKSCILPPSSFSSTLNEEEFGEDINAVVAADIFVIVSIYSSFKRKFTLLLHGIKCITCSFGVGDYLSQVCIKIFIVGHL